MFVDPLAEQYIGWTPYHYVHQNPINLIDHTGMAAIDWEPDKNGNLISEVGDNSRTLADKLEISETEASKMINSQGLKRDNYVQTDANVKEGQTLKVNDTRQRIANIAEYNIGSESWNLDVSRGDYPEGSNKCNVFVGEVTSAAEASPGKPNVINPRMSKLPFVDEKYGFPLAGQWADSSYSIDNWRTLGANEKLMRGDIASYSFNYSDASGHVAIVTSRKGFTVGTSGTNNRISRSDFGFNPERSNGNKIVFRRYIGN